MYEMIPNAGAPGEGRIVRRVDSPWAKFGPLAHAVSAWNGSRLVNTHPEAKTTRGEWVALGFPFLRIYAYPIGNYVSRLEVALCASAFAHYVPAFNGPPFLFSFCCRAAVDTGLDQTRMYIIKLTNLR